MIAKVFGDAMDPRFLSNALVIIEIELLVDHIYAFIFCDLCSFYCQKV
jgi:hypothetical protein